MALADTILLNKTDLVDEAGLARAEAAVDRANPEARLLRSVRCDVALSEVLDRGAFDMARMEVAAAGRDHGPHEHFEIDCVSIRLHRPLERSRLLPWLQQLVIERGADLLRAKGIVELGRIGPALRVPGRAHDDGHRRVAALGRGPAREPPRLHRPRPRR